MTHEEFIRLQKRILRMSRNPDKDKRIRAVTYEQAMQNREAGIPLFGWEPHAPEKLRAERVAEWRKLHQSKRYIAAEAELWSAIAMAVDMSKAF